ncbi:DnaJ family domain-containing protein [Ectobacillus ponti]|uniref:DUF1992 domain-containing protein n=1 Tax=Ectobacillus ponti TaxID=2961894 RepID=A0AA41X6T9_9BACI|nr:DnaJ family domain-containing protein [Ectobacillus ponti]MCP8969887.1 DUF1992 domain-containing protein [Ectobacillus ponti]
MDVFFTIAEEHIKKAVAKGDFENLPGKGRPLELEDLSGVPEELRMGYKILKNARILPEELQLKKDMLTLSDLLACCQDETEKERLQQELNAKTLRFHQAMEKRKIKDSGAYGAYREKLLRRLH